MEISPDPTPDPAHNISLELGFMQNDTFGIVRANIPESNSIYNIVHWVFTVDQSGSMNDICKDGYSKIHHIRQTITYIMEYLLQTSQDTGQLHYISLIGFSNYTKNICSLRLVDSVLISELSTILADFRPGGTTSFEAALPATSTSLSIPIPNTTSEQIVQRVNIFMTDGEITSGTSNIDILKSLYSDHKVPHIFVGVGTDNASDILESLADVSKGSHFFIESVENAGLVYGEIIYDCLNEIMNDVIIGGENIEIYDYKANIWRDNLNITNLSSGKSRVWHVRTTNDAPPSATMKFKFVGDSEMNLNIVKSKSFSPDVSTKDIKKYWWRQKSQELIARVRNLLAMRSNDYIRTNINQYANQQYVRSISPPAKITEGIKKDANLLLDSAKQGRWNIVDIILNQQPNLINVRPEPRRFSVLHHAIYQNDIEIVLKMIRRGADCTASTSDGISCRKLACKFCIDALSNGLFQQKSQELEYKAMHEALHQELDTFLADMKKYMTDTPELENDPFMRSLCDDIYISILGLGSEKGEMFVLARQSTSGNERAYNMNNVEVLRSSSTTTMSDRHQEHLIDETSTTSYATQGTLEIMRSCSGDISQSQDQTQNENRRPVIPPPPIRTTSLSRTLTDMTNH